MSVNRDELYERMKKRGLLDKEDASMNARAKALTVAEQNEKAKALGITLPPVAAPGGGSTPWWQGGSGGIRASERNASSQGSLRGMWSGGSLTRGSVDPFGAANAAPAGSTGREGLNPVRGAVSPASGGPLERTMLAAIDANQDDAENLLIDAYGLGAGSAATRANAANANAALAGREPVRAATLMRAYNDQTTDAIGMRRESVTNTQGRVRNGLVTTGAGAEAIFGVQSRPGQRAFPEGRWYIPGEAGRPEGTVRRENGTEITVGGTGSAGAISLGNGISYIPPPPATMTPAQVLASPGGVEGVFPNADMRPFEVATDMERKRNEAAFAKLRRPQEGSPRNWGRGGYSGYSG